MANICFSVILFVVGLWFALSVLGSQYLPTLPNIFP